MNAPSRPGGVRPRSAAALSAALLGSVALTWSAFGLAGAAETTTTVDLLPVTRATDTSTVTITASPPAPDTTGGTNGTSGTSGTTGDSDIQLLSVRRVDRTVPFPAWSRDHLRWFNVAPTNDVAARVKSVSVREMNSKWKAPSEPLCYPVTFEPSTSGNGLAKTWMFPKWRIDPKGSAMYVNFYEDASCSDDQFVQSLLSYGAQKTLTQEGVNAFPTLDAFGITIFTPDRSSAS